MTDNPDNDASADLSSDESRGAQTTPVTSNYKVLGRLSAENGVGVLGQNDASSGTPIGVQGSVPNSSSGYGLSTPDDVKIEGIVSTNETDFVVEVGTTSTGDAKNVVLGHTSNVVKDGAVGATIGGGGYNDGSFTLQNLVHDNWGTIGGGTDNEAGSPGDDDPTTAEYAIVGGGSGNKARGDSSAILGGDSNEAKGKYDTVGGGNLNVADQEGATVGGGQNNDATAQYATTAGGSQNRSLGRYGTVTGGKSNEAKSKYGTVAGGNGNVTNQKAGVVAGGANNNANGQYAATGGGANNENYADYGTIAGGESHLVQLPSSHGAIGGGKNNEVSTFSTVPGGKQNYATGAESFAAGVRAKAENTNSFVWHNGLGYHDIDGDGTKEGLSSAKDIGGTGVTGNDTFHASASGGFRFIINGYQVSYLSSSSGGWASTSSRAAKKNLESVDTSTILDGIEEMEVYTWEYRDETGDGNGTRHIGPMAEDFHDVIDVGESDKHIDSLDADGMLFAAVKGLAERLEEKNARIDDLKRDVADLETENEELHERNDDLEARLAVLEDHLGVETGSDHPTPADD